MANDPFAIEARRGHSSLAVEMASAQEPARDLYPATPVSQALRISRPHCTER